MKTQFTQQISYSYKLESYNKLYKWIIYKSFSVNLLQMFTSEKCSFFMYPYSMMHWI